MFVILQKYDFSSKSQQDAKRNTSYGDVCDTAKVRFFKQITTLFARKILQTRMFVILQKYDFSSKSQRRIARSANSYDVCDTAKVRFFKQITTDLPIQCNKYSDVCDTAKVRFFKQITTLVPNESEDNVMFVILQKYDFSSKSQRVSHKPPPAA